MSSSKKMSGYVSDIDRFLQDFDKKHPSLSKSQQQEIAKSKRVSLLRDDALFPETPLQLWDEF